MSSRKGDWKPQLLNVKLQVDSTSADKVPRASDMKETAVSLTPTNVPRRPANYDRNSPSIAGHKESSSSHDPDQKEER